MKPKVRQSLDYSTLSPNAQPLTLEAPNYEALMKEAPIKHDQIEKANEFLRLQRAAKHRATVHATLKEMGLDMVEEEDNLPNSFFCIFTWSDPDLHLLEPEEQVEWLCRKLVEYISDNGSKFTKVCIYSLEIIMLF